MALAEPICLGISVDAQTLPTHAAGTGTHMPDPATATPLVTVITVVCDGILHLRAQCSWAALVVVLPRASMLGVSAKRAHQRALDDRANHGVPCNAYQPRRLGLHLCAHPISSARPPNTPSGYSLTAGRVQPAAHFGVDRVDAIWVIAVKMASSALLRPTIALSSSDTIALSSRRHRRTVLAGSAAIGAPIWRRSALRLEVSDAHRRRENNAAPRDDPAPNDLLGPRNLPIHPVRFPV